MFEMKKSKTHSIISKMMLNQVCSLEIRLLIVPWPDRVLVSVGFVYLGWSMQVLFFSGAYGLKRRKIQIDELGGVDSSVG